MNMVGPSSLDALRNSIARLERGQALGENRIAGRLPLGLVEIDRALPEGGLRLGAVHELRGVAAEGFALWLAGRRAGPVLYCLPAPRRGRRRETPAARGWAALGLEPDSVTFAFCKDDAECFWAMEEGLQAGCLKTVIAEPEGTVDLTASRRLQLAAGKGETLGLVLGRDTRDGATTLFPSAVASRWSATPAPALADDVFLRWRLDLLRCRGGFADSHSTWLVEMKHATGDLALVSAPVDRPRAAAGAE